jgi:NAD(P)-dependent dehydrogenase (short-subunit alcohol dehydrogenase family)
MAQTILITGASRGFGRIWAEAFLDRGDKVIATARNTKALEGLVKKYGNAVLPLQLDVTNRSQSFDVVKKSYEHFGRLDVVINNAGYGLFGAIEETSEQDVRNQLEANVFGVLWVTQAALPIMRQQGHGHIIQVSSVLGLTALPILGIYNASKFAVEGLSETLAAEVKGFGINVTIVEPNGFATGFLNGSSVHSQPIDAYDEVKEAFKQGLTDESFGNPDATAEAILKLVDSPNPPLRLFLGKVALPWIKQVYSQRLAEWESWDEVAVKAHG